MHDHVLQAKKWVKKWSVKNEVWKMKWKMSVTVSVTSLLYVERIQWSDLNISSCFYHQPICDDVEAYEPSIKEHMETGNALDVILRSTQTPISTIPHRSSTSVGVGKRSGDRTRQRPTYDQMEQSFISDGKILSHFMCCRFSQLNL